MDDLEEHLVDIRAMLSELEVKMVCMQRQLNAIEVKQTLKHIDSKQDIYLAAVLIGAVVFLALRMVPV